VTVTYQQTDTTATFNVGCSARSAGVQNASRQAIVGGTAGTTEQSVNPDNQGGLRACFNFDVPVGDAPNIATWTDGNWQVTINFTSGDPGTFLKEVHVCDNNGGSYTTVCSETGLTVATTAGSTTRTIAQGGDHSPQAQSTSRPFIVIVLENTDPHGGSACGITPSSTVVAPYTLTPPQIPGQFLRRYEHMSAPNPSLRR